VVATTCGALKYNIPSGTKATDTTFGQVLWRAGEESTMAEIPFRMWLVRNARKRMWECVEPEACLRLSLHGAQLLLKIREGGEI